MIDIKKENYKGKRIVIVDGATKQALPLIRGYHQMGCSVTVLCSGKLDAGYVYRYTDQRIIISIDKEKEEYTYQSILNVLRNDQYDVLIPVVDFYAIMFSKHKEELERYVRVCVEDWAIFENACDKQLTMKACMENNVPCPRTALIDDLAQFDDKQWNYPLVVKPRSSYGAKGFHIVNSTPELINRFKAVSNIFGPTLIQEYIPQTDKQFQVELVMDKNLECKMFVMMHIASVSGHKCAA